MTSHQLGFVAHANGEQGNGLDTAAGYYFSRHLRITDDQEQTRKVDEDGILKMAGPKIVLGEPGMGKSDLIRELGRRLAIRHVTAIRFMHSKNPASFVVAGKPLLIDGLDEAMACREGDAVDKILGKLEAAGAPDFILSCRAREWQTRSATKLRQIYDTDPSIFTLEALSREEANSFLLQRYKKANSEHVLNHLDEHGIAELYSNPLTLSLMGKVAETDVQLPATRAALFERVCTLIWPEHDPDRQDSGLAKITEDQALSAAGALMAGLLFAGADAVSLSGPGQLQDGDVRLVDLVTLPGASAGWAVFSSKLFHSVGVGRARPIHRVIAEFLGARWLAQQASTARVQRRLLAQLHGSGAVPASLRGVHAWLAFHSVKMAKAVIEADPFGVLRYGETASLTPEQANYMFDALQKLSEVDPYFRAQDWDCHTATGLMIPNLQAKIEATIASAESNSHFRSLLIEGIKDTPLAGDLAGILEAVMLASDRFYGERKEAATALMPYRERSWWQRAIVDLHDQGTEDSTRLARNMIESIDCDVTDEVFVATLFAEMGVTISPLPRIKKQRMHTIHGYRLITEALPATRLINVLNLLSDYAPLLNSHDWRNANGLTEIVSSLIVRAIDEKAVLPKDAALLWQWLGTLHAEGFHRDEKKLLQARLDEDDTLRHAIQQYALYVARPKPTIWESDFDMGPRMVGLMVRPKDVTWFIEQLAGSDNKDPSLRDEWCDLMRLGICSGSFDPDMRAASRKFQRGDAQLEAFVHKLENPKKPPWKQEQERQAAKKEKKKHIAREERRRFYFANKAELRAGELRKIIGPAEVYLGLVDDLIKEQSPIDRLIEWVGAEFAVDALAGFDAVLYRSDIPSSVEVANGFAEGDNWLYGSAIMAGLLARQRANCDLSDLPADVRTTGLLLCHEDHCNCVDDDLAALTDALEQIEISTARKREDFARLWIEPSLAAGTSHIPGLYTLAHDQHWLATGVALAPNWLNKFPNLPEKIELALVDCLTRSNAFTPLVAVATARANKVFSNEKQRFLWLAIDVLVRFDMVRPSLLNIGTQHPEFIWYLRDRFQLERRGPMLPVGTAQAKWIISQFRTQWSYTVLVGSSSGVTNSYDATDFLRTLINSIADDTSVEASEAMQELIFESADSYSELIQHMAAEQRQKRAEEDFAPLPPKDLGKLLADGPPSNVDDLKSLILEELAVAQKILIGDDVDQVRDFWGSNGKPNDENRCRDRLAAMIEPELRRYDVQRITEADMPNTKRADLAFLRGQIQIPMEVKGQWHPEVWQAATDQLDLKYLIDWRSEKRGIYCVLWFGDLPSLSGRRLKLPPNGMTAPKSASEMRQMLIEGIPEARRALIDVVVLDLTAGKP